MYARRECSIHEIVNNHPNVVKLYDTRETDTQYEMYMEYCDKADNMTKKIREVSQLDLRNKILSLCDVGAKSTTPNFCLNYKL